MAASNLKKELINTRLLWTLLFSILLVRLLTMALFPVLDTTESRYAEISRLMMATGDWTVLQFSEGVPFWGKPPLFAWITAASFNLLGTSEFAARIPHFLLGMATLLLVSRVGRFQLDQTGRLLAVLILASTPLFFVISGTVMTESGLLFSTTLSMVGFWLCMTENSRLWGLAFFAGLGIGMLAKGPVSLVVTFLPILLWAGTGKQWYALRKLPWFVGTVLFLVIFIPWYLAAEWQSPGFLEYFIYGEHFLRFVEPGWAGDLYGTAHQQPTGMIWLLWFQATAAWGILMALVAVKYCLKQISKRTFKLPPFSNWQSYLLWWMIAPLLFFTFSGNILWTYVLSGMPAFALMLASQTRAKGDER